MQKTFDEGLNVESVVVEDRNGRFMLFKFLSFYKVTKTRIREWMSREGGLDSRTCVIHPVDCRWKRVVLDTGSEAPAHMRPPAWMSRGGIVPLQDWHGLWQGTVYECVPADDVAGWREAGIVKARISNMAWVSIPASAYYWVPPNKDGTIPTRGPEFYWEDVSHAATLNMLKSLGHISAYKGTSMVTPNPGSFLEPTLVTGLHDRRKTCAARHFRLHYASSSIIPSVQELKRKDAD